MLEGEVDYRHGEDVYSLKPGDSLFFDADARMVRKFWSSFPRGTCR